MKPVIARNAVFCWLLVAAFFSGVLTAAAAATDLNFLSFGTGQTSGVYYPTGRFICDAFNRSYRKEAQYCSAEATPGSVYNLEALRNGEIEFALVQADVQFAAVKGLARWADRPMTNLRSVLSLHPEVLTIIARRDSGIEGIGDLKGKRVNIGNPGSGTRATWDEVASGLGIGASDLALTSELKPDAAAELLCANKLDASVVVVGHPNKVVADELATCDLKLVPATGPAVSKLIAEMPYIVYATISGADYGKIDDVASFGIRATLVTTAEMSDETVYRMAKTVLTNLDGLKTLEPVMADLKPSVMAKESLTAPLHPGAAKAIKEFGPDP